MKPEVKKACDRLVKALEALDGLDDVDSAATDLCLALEDSGQDMLKVEEQILDSVDRLRDLDNLKAIVEVDE